MMKVGLGPRSVAGMNDGASEASAIAARSGTRSELAETDSPPPAPLPPGLQEAFSRLILRGIRG